MQVLVLERFQEFLDAAPDAMVVVGRDGRIVGANIHTHSLFGYLTTELIGQPIEMLVPVRLRDWHVAHREGYRGDPHRRPMGAGLELSGMRKDGTEFPVEISLSPLHGDEGTVVVAAIRDVTDRKQIEYALQEKNAELERANQVKDHFLASISHELRTPLNAIIGFTGTLLMQLPGPLNTDQATQLRTIQTSATFLLSLINDLLDLAKIESGKVEIEFEQVHCREVLAEVAATMRPMAEEKGLRFRVALPEEPLLVRSDRRALTQIVLNLVSNAVKFTTAGEISLAVDRQRGATRISVTDTGPGITADDQTRLFQALEQFETTSAHRHEGSGLGLHLSQQLAALLGAEIACDSEFGRGSVFTLILPPGDGHGTTTV